MNKTRTHGSVVKHVEEADEEAASLAAIATYQWVQVAVETGRDVIRPRASQAIGTAASLQQLMQPIRHLHALHSLHLQHTPTTTFIFLSSYSYTHSKQAWDPYGTYTTTTLASFIGLFSRTTWVSQYQKGKTSLYSNDARDDGVLRWQWRQLDHMETICTSLQTDNHTNTSSLNFYRPDALPDAQPTVSKHWRQHHYYHYYHHYASHVHCGSHNHNCLSCVDKSWHAASIGIVQVQWPTKPSLQLVYILAFLSEGQHTYHYFGLCLSVYFCSYRGREPGT